MKNALLIFFIFFIFLSINSFAQLSNKHWIPPLHSRDANQISDQWAYLSTAETTPFLVDVTDGSGNPYTGSPFSLSATTPVIINIGNGQPTKMFLSLNEVNTVVSDKGIILEGNKNFYVSFRMRHTNHSETLISKGRSGIGTRFRLGGMINESLDPRKSFVASVMATEDNTTIDLEEYRTGVVFKSGTGDITSANQSFPLMAGQSIVFSGYTNTAANIDGIIGALISSDKPIAVNTGNILGGIVNGNADITLDQIVSSSQIGTEYIFIEGNGSPAMETPLIVADKDGTQIDINGIYVTTIGKGESYLVPNTYYVTSTNPSNPSNHRNLYVKTSNPVFAYQLLGGGSSAATSGLNFIPPLSCFFQKSVNIPKVNQIGSTNYTSDLMILTNSLATLTVNGNIIPTAQAQDVLGNNDWVTYRISNITGDANVISTGPLAVGVFGYQGTASGFAGYYSGFGSTPIDSDVTVCTNSTHDLFTVINGNPDTGGTWTVPLGGNPLNGNIFDPSINISGDYSYSFTKQCNSSLISISVKVTVTVQQSKNAGVSNSISLCTNSPAFDLFGLLGINAETGGTWFPALSSGTGVFNPLVDLSGAYTYSFPAIGSCSVVSATINVTNNALPIISTVTDFKKCDDNFDGNDTNGFVDFDLTTKNNEVLGIQTGINVTYYTIQNDADIGINPITTLYSTDRIIYARLTNAISGCHIVTSFNLVVQPLPTVSPTTIVQCDDDADGISDFNLTEKNSFISGNSGNETFTFYKTLSGADLADSSLLITTPKAYTSANGSVWARVENTNGCFSVAQLDLIVSTTRIPASFSHSFSECDDFIDAINDDKDGVATFNFTAVTDEIKTNYLSSSSLYSIKYYKNEDDALAESNEITNTTNYRNSGYKNQQTIWVRVESTLDNACYGLGPHVVLTVNPKPNIDINKDHTQDNLVCSNLPTFFVTLDAGINDGSPTNDFTYVWSKDGMDLGETNPTLDVNVEGNYSVKVSTVLGCSRTRNIKVTASDVAKISNIDIVDLSTINTVTVNVTGQGQYEYSIDEPSGPFQTSNFFDNVPAGIHDVYINDINGCGTVSTPISVIGVPKYFTPNNDGYNDYWNVKGITANFNANSTIYIYDRYGKLLKQLIPTAEGWDGTFNGLPLPSDDYWYTVKLEDGREAKGHFSLKR